MLCKNRRKQIKIFFHVEEFAFIIRVSLLVFGPVTLDSKALPIITPAEDDRVPRDLSTQKNLHNDSSGERREDKSITNSFETLINTGSG